MKTQAHEFLDIERECGFDVPQSCYDTLDDLLEKAGEIDTDREPAEVLYDIGRLLERERYSSETNGLFSESLTARKLPCRHSSLLYYAVGEVLKLPLFIMNLPDHAYIMWSNDIPPDIEEFDGVKFIRWVKNNLVEWETTSNSKKDIFVTLSEYKFSKEALKKGIYLDKLNEKGIKAMAFNSCGLFKYKKQDYDGAIACFDKAIELNPNDPKAYNNRGNAKDEKGDLEGAFEDYNKSLKIDPNNTSAYHNRGCLEKKRKRFSKAVADFSKAVELDPNHAESYYGRAEAKEELFDFEGAEADFQKAIELDPGLAKKCKIRRDLAVIKGDYTKGVAYFTYLIKKEPRKEEHYSDRAFAHLFRGSFVDFIVDLGRLLSITMKYGVSK